MSNDNEVLEQRSRTRRPARDRLRPWLLAASALLAIAAGAVYLREWLAGIRGADLLGFTAWAVCPTLLISLLLLFAALSRPAQR
jgi:membrane-associated PAP2 superfamily phosphatase